MFYRLRGWLMVPPIAFALFSTRWETENHLLSFGLGGIVFAVGLAVRIWAQTHLHYRLKIKKALTIAGPYQYLRNPIYVGNTLIIASCCLMAEMPWLAALMMLYCAVIYNFVVRHEEARLTRKFGEAYLEYTRRVPRWIPRFGPAAGAHKGLVRKFVAPSVAAEWHNLLLPLLFVIKELIGV